MLPWILVVSLLQVTVFGIGRPRFECGEHGRFEYCIDGVPHCIVGCHCHPGYYFDTETKTCEPNAKIIQEYRRRYAEPTRIPFHLSGPSDMSELVPTPTPTTIDNQVDNATANDTADLGDWLYNQFFKTIENQIVNKSDSVKDKDAVLTRRKGLNSELIKPKRRSRKLTKKSKKRKKVKGLRRKLLRITEDDSLFDSHSNSDESGDTSDSSDSNSDSDTSGSSDENRPNPPNPPHKHDDKEHGHRKILVINKKPKPPLPSFIFLPNYDTPFYPPIGLPPPPVMPMYPMVPVPPMPMYPPPMPYPGPVADCTTNSPTTASSSKTTEDDAKNNTEHDTNTKPDSNTTDKPVVPPIDTTTEPPDNTTEITEQPINGTRLRSYKLNRKQRNKFLRDLREKMNLPPLEEPIPMRRYAKPSNNYFVDPELEMSYFGGVDPHDYLLAHRAYRPRIEEPENVDFKYLAQLIHRIDPNITQDKTDNITKGLPASELKLRKGLVYPNELTSMSEASSGRRYLPRSNERDDSYYGTLGQQIASLIRALDNTGQRQLDIKLGRNQVTPHQPIFNENGYGSRSYWERSVRSPLNKYYQPYEDGLNHLENNYEHLLNLENKVEVVASTSVPLSLRELEDIIFIMDREKSKLQGDIDHIEPTTMSNVNLNINLLPRQNEQLVIGRKNYGNNNVLIIKKELEEPQQRDNLQNIVEFNKSSIVPDEHEKPLLRNRTNPIEDLLKHNLHYNLRGILMQHFKNIIDRQTNKVDTNVRRRNMPTLLSETDVRLNNMMNYDNPPPKVSRIANLGKTARNDELFKAHVKPLTRQVRPNHQSVQNYKTSNYYTNKYNPYAQGKKSSSHQFPTTYLGQPRPSYFHHESHHFDYFD